MKKTLLLTAMMFAVTAAVAQSEPQGPRGPQRQGPPIVQCDEMKKLMKAVQDHRATCETCKTNFPRRGMGMGPMGPRGQGQGQGRGPHGPPAPVPAPAPEK